MKVEVELRSIITKQKYDQLLKFFKSKAKFLGKEEQLTHYLDDNGTLRLQKTNDVSKIWLKQGRIHETVHEEMQVEFPSNRFKDLVNLFDSIGKDAKIKWIRIRYNFRWEGANVMLDYTKGYAHILEIEIISEKKNSIREKRKIELLFKKLGVLPTPKREFDSKYNFYRKNWKKLIG